MIRIGGMWGVTVWCSRWGGVNPGHLSRSISDAFVCFFFFFNDTATTEIYTLSLHDALPILFLTAVHESAVGAGR